ncbi:hypothetical protein E3Q06_00104 [Wallemia mellicola]|uniref:Activator of Hsp90 ATPase AHSA1-like N-terminal domain-containing protein n=2 Tax=Wallemia mellicola TaxID=1708541 RepID=A0AB74KH53_9BASI|nr:hypothetical protein E3Q24_00871 [Wallemia mellicola]TIB90913.1 hypothetical protein E3Q21_00103 [Wallemia mellicola]TIB92731.1 hypothetical protein E3Q20_00104 [Wallemia mellicola]TIC44474.1 hypothetical protein E3Q07_00104 [Wallemia mellicola]TIC53697.1 hypothetical protein E3Q06_00104 [Wallemia mellicola]
MTVRNNQDLNRHQFRSIVAQGPSAASGSSYSAGGAGAGFHPGRNFYQGYHGYGRAFTQANNNNNPDDEDGRSPSKAYLSRRQSVSNSSRSEVVKAIRDQRRRINTVAKSEKNHTGRPRSNSTASIDNGKSNVEELSDEVESPDKPPPQASHNTQLGNKESDHGNELIARISAAKDSNDFQAVKRIVHSVYTITDPSVELWDTALEALCVTRPDSFTVEDAVSFYNDMIARDLKPTAKTYSNLITILCLRDNYVQKSLQSVNTRKVWDPSLESKAQELESEQNFRIAMSIFNLAVRLNVLPTDVYTYNWLLMSCKFHKDVDSAINVFSVLESLPQVKAQHATYSVMIDLYGSVGDLEGATVIFEDYVNAAKKKMIDSDPAFATLPANKATTVYNSMITANFNCNEALGGVELFQQILEAPMKLRPDTVAAVIEGFVRNGDVSSALEWLKRTAAASAEGSQVPHPPVSSFYFVITSLLRESKIDEAQSVFELLKECQNKFTMEPTGAELSTFSENVIGSLIKNIENVEQVVALASEIFRHQMIEKSSKGVFYPPINDLIYIASVSGRFDLAMGLYIQWAQAGKIQFIDQGLYAERNIWHKFVVTATETLVNTPGISLQQTFDAYRIAYENNVICSFKTLISIIQKVDQARKDCEGDFKLINLTLEQWKLYTNVFLQLAKSQVNLEDSNRSVPLTSATAVDFVSDIRNTFGQNSEDIAKVLHVNDLGFVLSKLIDYDFATEQLARIGYRFNGMECYTSGYVPLDRVNSDQSAPIGYPSFDSSDASSEQTPPTTPETTEANFTIDEGLSEMISRHDYRKNLGVSPEECYAVLMDGITNGLTGNVSSLANLANALGRKSEISKAKKVYTHAYDVIQNLSSLEERSMAWFKLEDAMISGLGHGGDIEGATQHRLRIIQAGGAPSADAYAACINNVKETTDDVTFAQELWDESRSLGVKGNTFLFNSIISKLSKARKAHAALEILDLMIAERVRPSSVTYGAIINACTRIGDETSAVTFFNKMVQQNKFQLRVPPFNTMIQFYTHTKPNRERALYYYGEMLSAKVAPSAHTYKLLLDAYGSIAPVDKDSLNKVFETIVNDPRAAVSGTHWASLIHSAGYVEKDVEAAVKIFESIETHPSNRNKVLPDAIVYEALLNVFVENQRQDLIPKLLDSIKASKVHQTAYISNLLIRGYAQSGDIARSREVFESMVDPPMGAAASGNHAGDSQAINVVYREPSTWSEMIKAELEAKSTENAQKLIARMEERMYPLAVTSKIASLIKRFVDSRMSSANWHWKQLDCSKFAKEYFKEKLVGLKVNDELTIEELKECDGDVTLGQRKSKLVTIYDLKIVVEWSVGEQRGRTHVPEVSHEAIDGLDEYVFETTLIKGQADGQFDHIRKEVIPQTLKPIFDQFPVDLREKYGAHVQISQSNTPTPSPAPEAAPAVKKTEKVEVPQQKVSQKGSLNTSTVRLEERYQISADEFFDVLTNKQRVPMWTRAPAEIEPKVGANVVLFGGGVKGKVTDVVPGKKITMDWSLTGGKWPEGHNASLTISLNQGDDSTTAEFILNGVPIGLEEDVQPSLEQYYIKPLKLLFGTVL